MWSSQMQRISHFIGGLLCKGANLPPLGLMFKMDCPITHKPLAPSLPQPAPFSPTYPHMWYNFKLAEDNIGTSDVFLI